jgi:hypothetical protein
MDYAIHASMDCESHGDVPGITRVPGVPYWWFQEASRVYVDHRYSPCSHHGLVWRHRVLSALFDQTGYWAIRIVTGVPDALPFVGPILVGFVVNAESVGLVTPHSRARHLEHGPSDPNYWTCVNCPPPEPTSKTARLINRRR